MYKTLSVDGYTVQFHVSPETLEVEVIVFNTATRTTDYVEHIKFTRASVEEAEKELDLFLERNKPKRLAYIKLCRDLQDLQDRRKYA